MKVIIKGEAKEIAALVLAVQERRKKMISIGDILNRNQMSREGVAGSQTQLPEAKGHIHGPI